MEQTRNLVLEGVQLYGEGEPVDLHIEDGRIAALARARDVGAARIVLPAFVDLHTHLREPGGEQSETMVSGTRAARAGGYSDVFAMANTDPVTDSEARVADIRRRSEGMQVRVHPVSAATEAMEGRKLVDIRSLRAAGVALFSDDGHCVTDDGLVLDLLSELAEHGGVFAQHAQSSSIVGDGVIDARVAQEVGCAGWPSVGEEAIVARDLAIADATGGHLHVCHISSKRTVDLIRQAKAQGVRVTAEVTPHHLFLTNEDARRRGPSLKVNPPLRSPEDVSAVRSALLDGTIDAIATDHAPHTAEAKSGEWGDAAFGFAGIETALSVSAAALWPGDTDVDWRLLSDRMTTRPARIGGLPARGLHVGASANLVVVEPVEPTLVREEDLVGASRNTPFTETTIRYRVARTIVNEVFPHQSEKE